jgi:Na+/melibiose symporter-like transporter
LKVNLSPKGRLWHHRDFNRLWFSDTVSQIGNQFTQVALPLVAILILNVNGTQIAILRALETLSFPLLALFVGVWADRFRKQRIMVICNFGRMALLGSIPLTYYLLRSVFTINLFYLVALLTGIFTVFFDISYQAYLPVLVDKSDLIEGNQKLQTSQAGAQVVGPTVAGTLYALVGGPLTIAGDAIGYFVSALSLASIRKKEPRPPKTPGATPNFSREMKEGIHVVLKNRTLSCIAGSTGTSNLGSSILQPALIFFIISPLYLNMGSRPVLYGAFNAIGTAGFLVGVLITTVLTRKLGGVGKTLAISIGSAFVAMSYVFIPRGNLILEFALLSVVSFVSVLLIAPYNINQISLRQAITPNRLQGRMNATMRTIVWGTIPLGALIGGVLLEPNVLGIVNTIVLGSVIAGSAFLWIVMGPVIKIKTQPQPLKEEEEEKEKPDRPQDTSVT